ncbi:MAG: type Z 30S ribosomal protein S14, partial [Brevinema sp.]
MAKQSMIQRWKKAPKFSARAYNRCNICGRPRSYMRD